MFKTPSRAASTATLVAMCLAGTALLAQQYAAPKPEFTQITKLVCQMIEKEHLIRSPINDVIAGRTVDHFIKELDPQKLYFLQSDVDEFNQVRTTLDDSVKQGNIDWAYSTFKRYLERLTQRMAEAERLVDATYDFTVKETMVYDAKELKWAVDDAEINERWRKRIKYDLLLFRLEKLPEEEAKKKLHSRYRNIKKNMFQTEPEDILEIFLSSLTSSYDPHSSYMSPRSEKEFRTVMKLSLDGIGAALKSEDGFTTVAQIVKGGAASRDGRLKVKDRIVGVGQKAEEIVDVVDMKLSNVVDMIRGERGTKVFLRIMPDGATETKVYEITRDKVELKDQEVKGEIIDVSTRIPGTRGRVGIVHIPSFYRDFQGQESGQEDFKSTTRDVKAVLKDFAAKGGVDALLIDLRFNGGGALSEAIELSGLFIDEGAVVQVKDQRGNVRHLDDEDTRIDFNGPLVVVCNRLAASASEIFAGVIRDYQRGIVVGDTTTHGKGTVQSVMPVGKRLFDLGQSPDRGALKLTINQFYRVNGDSTQKLGVPSDVVLPSLLDHMDLGEASLDNVMAFDRVPPADHKNFRAVAPATVSLLRDRSKARVAASKEFTEINDNINKYLSRKKRKSISLNEEELKQERLQEEEKTKKEADDQTDKADGPLFPSEAYNNELLAITLDYVSALNGTLTAKK
ncbi:MAG: carboxyl-terminal protease [Planctomycetaceae bacterium]|nr:carboxyl-terminal protease [Planctomycetaceae bacterium]